MGFWKRLFGLERKTEQEDEEQQIVYRRENVNFNNPEERKNYITSCLEQMADAEKEISILTGEYSLVTAYLTDMEEVEALPEEPMGQIRATATVIKRLEQESQEFLSSKSRLSDVDYAHIRSMEQDVEEGIRKIKEAENFQKIVKQDMRRLEAEKQAYRYRKNELYGFLSNYRGMVSVILITMIVSIVMLLVMQFVFKLQTVIAYFVLIPVAVILLVLFFVRFLDARKELEKVERAQNRLIQLQNKVKIRYVNNTNLLNYYYLKFNVESAAKLEDLWERYEDEKEKRLHFAEVEDRLDSSREKLRSVLVRFRVKYPDRLLANPDALIDAKEMVESRHEMILRRQALRKQMDYNRDLIGAAATEIKEVVNQYPRYENEILAMLNEEEKKYVMQTES
ncbi:MAG: hypothetical protein ACI4EX_12185 [Lachnospiraceae bacterium]